MANRRSTQSTDQLGFTFEPPVPARRDADLAGLDRAIAAAVAQALKDDDRPREVVAGAMSALLDEEVTRFMLDAYASRARDNHNISAGRLLALVAVTGRHDLLDGIVRRIGAALLVGEEIHVARLGHLEAKLRATKAEIRDLSRHAKPIIRGGNHA